MDRLPTEIILEVFEASADHDPRSVLHLGATSRHLYQIYKSREASFLRRIVPKIVVEDHINAAQFYAVLAPHFRCNVDSRSIGENFNPSLAFNPTAFTATPSSQLIRDALSVLPHLRRLYRFMELRGFKATWKEDRREGDTNMLLLAYSLVHGRLNTDGLHVRRMLYDIMQCLTNSGDTFEEDMRVEVTFKTRYLQMVGDRRAGWKGMMGWTLEPSEMAEILRVWDEEELGEIVRVIEADQPEERKVLKMAKMGTKVAWFGGLVIKELGFHLVKHGAHQILKSEARRFLG